jgi:hypothetical protein
MGQFKILVEDINCLENVSDILVSNFGLARMNDVNSNYEWSIFDYRTTDEMTGPVSPVVWRFKETEPYRFIINVSQFFSIKEYEIFRNILLKVSEYLNQPIQLIGDSYCPWTDNELSIVSDIDFPSYPFAERRGSEAGCFHAYHRFRNKIEDFKKVMSISNSAIDWRNNSDVLYGNTNPTDSLNQYVIPFLFGIYESYMKDTLWSLYWHSDDAIKSSYESLSKEKKNGIGPIEDLIKRDYDKYEKRSVLSLKALMDSFFILFENTEMTKVISLNDMGRLRALIDRRKLYAHRGSNFMFYKREQLFSDIDLIETCVERLYDYILEKHGWNISKCF